MKVDIYLVKDEYSTITNFRCSKKASDFASMNPKYIVERIEVELPTYYRGHEKTEVRASNSLYQDIIVEEIEISEKVEDLVNNHLIKIYNRTKGNKAETARILGLTYKTIYNKLNVLGIK